MQTVVIVCSVLEEKWCWFILARSMAAFDVVSMLCGVLHVDPHFLVPTIGDRNQMRIHRRSHSRNQTRQRITEVAILSTSEAVAFHHHVAAKNLFLLIQAADLFAF